MLNQLYIGVEHQQTLLSLTTRAMLARKFGKRRRKSRAKHLSGKRSRETYREIQPHVTVWINGRNDKHQSKMVDGRIKKYMDEVSLTGQPFVKDPSTTVGKLLEQKNAGVIAFHRMEVGEGIEKEETDFAQEVMAQVRGE